MQTKPVNVVADWKKRGTTPPTDAKRDKLNGSPIQFYRSTRKQTPQYAKEPDVVDKIECSICRHLFLPDTVEARREHRDAHVENDRSDAACGSRYCSEYTVVCAECNEDVCADFRCQRFHAAHLCEHFQHAATLDADAADLYLRSTI